MKKIKSKSERNGLTINFGIITGIVGILIQIILIMNLYNFFFEYYILFYSLSSIISIGIILYINYKDDNPSYKIPWIVLILLIPIIGVSVYLVARFTVAGNRKRINEEKKVIEKWDNFLKERYEEEYLREYIKDLYEKDISTYNEINYIWNQSKYPAYINTRVEYLEIGEKMNERMLEELKKAKKFIFMEYFIISEGKMWNDIYEVLKEKAKQGVEVRVILDYVGSLRISPQNFKKELKRNGIKVKIFNPFNKMLNMQLNFRDHRKITVIDGKVAFNGGINIGDEYINAYDKYGHWKDMSVMLEGEAVFSFTKMFLDIWNRVTKPAEEDSRYNIKHTVKDCEGIVIPYGADPADKTSMAENVYLNIINNSQKYLYITTPYLILGYNLIEALSRAANRGVDVRIITPYIPDKKNIQVLTRSHYDKLLSNDVKIYEYKPGFIHGKVFVSDDKTSVVGTINLDYRSLYLHYECATWMYKTGAEKHIKADFLETESKSILIDNEIWKNRPLARRIFESILRLFSALT